MRGERKLRNGTVAIIRQSEVYAATLFDTGQRIEHTMFSLGTDTSNLHRRLFLLILPSSLLQ